MSPFPAVLHCIKSQDECFISLVTKLGMDVKAAAGVQRLYKDWSNIK